MAKSPWPWHRVPIFDLLIIWTRPKWIPFVILFFILTCYNPLQFWIMQIVSVAQPCSWLPFTAQTNPIQLEEQRVWCHLWTLLYSHRSMSTQASSSFHKLRVQSGCLAPHVQITSSEDKSTSDNRGGEFIIIIVLNKQPCEHKISASGDLIQTN